MHEKCDWDTYSEKEGHLVNFFGSYGLNISFSSCLIRLPQNETFQLIFLGQLYMYVQIITQSNVALTFLEKF